GGALYRRDLPLQDGGPDADSTDRKNAADRFELRDELESGDDRRPDFLRPLARLLARLVDVLQQAIEKLVEGGEDALLDVVEVAVEVGDREPGRLRELDRVERLETPLRGDPGDGVREPVAIGDRRSRALVPARYLLQDQLGHRAEQ